MFYIPLSSPSSETRTVWVLPTSQSLIRLQGPELNRGMCKGWTAREESDRAEVMSVCFWSLLGATQTEPPSKQAHTHTHTQTHITPIFPYWSVGKKRVEVSRHMSEFLSLCRSHPICLCLIQYAPSPIRGPCFIHISVSPLLWPALVLCGFFVSVCLPFTWHTWINQSIQFHSEQSLMDLLLSHRPDKVTVSTV